MSFTDQLSETRANLARLEALAEQAPELVEHATLINCTPEGAQLYIHASRAPGRDWREFVARYPAAWMRENSVVAEAWDYRAQFQGVNICVIGAEKREAPQPLFAVEGAAA